MEVDTGSAVTLMTDRKFKVIFGKVKLSSSESSPKTYSVETIEQVGAREVTVENSG